MRSSFIFSLMFAMTLLLTPTVIMADEMECTSDECSEAMAELVRFSLNGSPDAQVIVALAYATGDGVPLNHTLARQHLKRALRNQDLRAWHIYSRWLRDGFIFEQDLNAATEALNRAADRGFLTALHERAIRNFSETATDNSATVADLERAAEELYKPSMYLLAQLKAAGLGTPQDIERAAELYAFLARSNYRESEQRLEGLVGSAALAEQKQTLSMRVVNEIAERYQIENEQAMEVITVSAARIETQDYVIDLAAQLDKLRVFDGRGSTGSNIRGQVCGRGTASCRVIYDAAAGTVSFADTAGGVINGGF
ncbi:tetratricopeptide repeat protein [Pseudidiomarina taiwanensis]|uniref:Sel1 repeat family protein n=1 Tax=Pseudidiomarina taiwanensis TaxID=337250 RepID=A0A432ZK11_9GAMM|nr:tetratricopeptide repeat protein [Pseudidiomarina taiwanensis]RUO78253.1 hypothetical protein CWI83_04245 [Pseudidiomarina taiwanensis]